MAALYSSTSTSFEVTGLGFQNVMFMLGSWMSHESRIAPPRLSFLLVNFEMAALFETHQRFIHFVYPLSTTHEEKTMIYVGIDNLLSSSCIRNIQHQDILSSNFR